jgi:anti-sigma regulatory factor (Ser/Thr protein kinase)
VTADSVTLPALAESVSSARRFVRERVLELGATAAIDDAETLVSELATNAVLHARTEYTIQVTRSNGLIRVRVHDLSAVQPRERHYGVDATTGRGIRLVTALAVDWGIDPEEPGKAIWFDLAADGNSPDTISWDEADIDALLNAFDGGDAGPLAPGALAMAA